MRLEKLRVRAVVMRNRWLRVEATESARERRRETRRKVLLGAALQSLVRADRCLRAVVRGAVQEHIAARPRDADLFTRSVQERSASAGHPPMDAKAVLSIRRRDVHRKIVLGAITLKLVQRDSELRARVERVLETLIATSPRDLALFELQGTEAYLERLCDSSRQA